MSKEINILFTSVGRRSYLVQYFREALGNSGKLYATNSIKFSTAFNYVDDHAVSPLIYSDEYIPFLLDCCRKWKISAIISLFDIDLMILARNRGLFEKNGVKLIVSDVDVIGKCNDKWHTAEFFRNQGINAPKTFLSVESVVEEVKSGSLSYPLIVKPRWGAGSIAVSEADDEQELRFYYEKTKKEIFASYLRYESQVDCEHSVLIQEKIAGQEYGLDIINDLDGNYITTIVKKKLGMRSGETDCAMTVSDERLMKLGERISTSLRHIANLDVDVIVDDDMYVIEMNARFGGGYPFSHVAGVDLPAAIVRWLRGESADKSLFDVKAGVLAQKEIGMAVL